MSSTQQKIRELLESINSLDCLNLYNYLVINNYFKAPASTKYHGNYEGGLAEHSYNVYLLFYELNKKYNTNLSHESIIKCSLLHDMCKIKLYILEDNKNIVYNKSEDEYIRTFGHAGYSLVLLENLGIKLTEYEKKIIKYHMGMYESNEISDKGNYTLAELKEAFDDKIIKLFYFCDDIVGQFIDKRKDNIVIEDDKNEQINKFFS